MIKRRRVTLSLGGFVWLASTRMLRANNPASPQDAHYVNHPGPGGITCATCQFYFPNHAAPAQPGHCQLITGPVGPSGHCDFYAAR
ncbi:MAG: hypothetical protein PHT60_01205 [Acidiphilium sp.]|nr:hypothetical protein [Acidiphilium sp.]MDD4934374.1 hypothetical protein [Acidiphilium sp.]